MASNEKLAEVFATRICKETKTFYLKYADVEKAAFQMAEWKDGHPRISTGKVLQLRRRAYKKGYNDAVKKACEWINLQAVLGWIEDVKVDEFLNDFKKEMKE